jgi:methylated-DNA-[protein]-cysteine S-methyltransferase
MSYQQLSKYIGNEKAVRAVASANGANAISMIIPCHRIIGSDGSLVGYAGGLPAKRKLLALEKSQALLL